MMAGRPPSTCPKTILKGLVNFYKDRATIGQDTLVLPELFIDNWARRVDLALIDADLHSIEIKSGADNLDRLAGQIEAMGRLFNTVTVCVASKHLAGLSDLPAHVGIVEVADSATGLSFQLHRAATRTEVADRRGLIHFLDRRDIVALLKAAGVPIPSRTFIYPLRDMAESLPAAQLKFAALASLRRRFSQKSEAAKLLLTRDHPQTAH